MFDSPNDPTPAPVPAAQPAPNPADTQNRIATQRMRRIASGGVQSTFLGSLGAGALPPPTATLTGLNK